jgi:methionyl-tRNA formyltransferase
MKAVFFTSGPFGSRLFEDFFTYIPETVLVTLPAKKKGRGQVLSGNDAEKLGRAKGVEVITQSDIRTPDFLAKIQGLSPDLLITADYGKIIPRSILQVPRIAAVNVHPSLLPRYRGATPIRAVLLDGESLTGVTLQTMSDKIDAGSIISQGELTITEDDDFGTLSEKLLIQARLLLAEFVKRLPAFNERPQDESLATYCTKPGEGDTTTDFQGSARLVRNRIRAFSPRPGITVKLRNRLVKILKAAVCEQPAGTNAQLAGTILVCGKEGLIVQTSPDALALELIQPENGKPMLVKDFINGYRPAVGDRFEPRISSA